MPPLPVAAESVSRSDAGPSLSLTFGLWLTITMAVTALVILANVERLNTHWLVPNAMAVILSLVGFAGSLYQIPIWLQPVLDRRWPACASLPPLVLSMLLLGLVAVLGYYVTPLGKGLYLTASVLGLWGLFERFKALRPIAWTPSATMTLILTLGLWTLTGIWLMLTASIMGYQVPYIETLLPMVASGGKAVKLGFTDPLFHASYAQMMHLHGLASAGLDGLHPDPYYVGSHAVMMGLSRAMGIPVFAAYMMVFPILMIPLLMTSLFSFVQKFGQKIGAQHPHPTLSGWMFLIPLIAIFGVLPAPIPLLERGLLVGCILGSESYLFSIVMLLVGGSVLFWALERFWLLPSSQDAPVSRMSLRSFSVKSLALPTLGLMLWVAALGVFKASVLVVVFPALLYGAWRLGAFRQPWLCLLIAALIGTAWGVYHWVIESGTGFEWRWFSWARDMDKPHGWWIWVYPTLWVWPLCYSALRLWPYLKPSTHSWQDLKAALMSRRLLDVELLWVVTLVGAVPGILWNLPSGNSGYFSDIQRWLALALLISCCARTFNHKSNTLKITSPLAVTLLILVLPLIVTIGQNFLGDLKATGKILKTIKHATRDHAPEVSERIALLRHLVKLNDLPDEVRRQSLLFISFETSTYWKMIPACHKGAFLAPALSGMAQLYGVPALDCKPYRKSWDEKFAYYYYHYPLRPDVAPASLTPIKLCEAVRARGMQRLWILDAIDKPATIRQYSCTNEK